MLKEKGIEAIIFDLGGVMVDLNFDRCMAEFVKLGFKGAEQLVSCYHPEGIFGALERGEVSGVTVCEYVRELSGLPLSDEAIYSAYRSLLDGIPAYKLEMLKALKSEGYKLYALSNINEVMMPVILEMMGDAVACFDKMFLSYKMGVMKPSREIYEQVIADIALKPSQTLFIDDGEANVAAARELGFNVYHAKGSEDYRFLFW